MYENKDITIKHMKVCEECEKEHLPIVALRMCLTCGHVGCCDSSIGKHATKHFKETQVIRLWLQFMKILGNGVTFMKNIIKNRK